MGSYTQGHTAPCARMLQQWELQGWTLADVAGVMIELGLPAARVTACELEQEPLSLLLPDRVCRPRPRGIDEIEGWGSASRAGSPMEPDDWVEIIDEASGGDVKASDLAERAVRIRLHTPLDERLRRIEKLNARLTKLNETNERAFLTLDYDPLLVFVPADAFLESEPSARLDRSMGMTDPRASATRRYEP
jgi:hypothetical protein